jgi:hypothetical protein
MILLSFPNHYDQNSLKKLETYCDKWGLTVNFSKSTIIIFNKGGRLIKKYQFLYKGVYLDMLSNHIVTWE